MQYNPNIIDMPQNGGNMNNNMNAGMGGMNNGMNNMNGGMQGGMGGVMPYGGNQNGMQQGVPQGMQQGMQQGMNNGMQFQMTNMPVFRQEDKGGTSILDLKRKQQMMDNNSQASYSQHSQHKENQERDRIKLLVRDINKSLDNYAPPQTNYTELDDDTIIDIDDMNNDDNIISNNIEQFKASNKNNKNSKWDISLIIKEVLLIVIIYVILSQPYVRNYIEKYVPLRGSDGSISVIGFALYGMVLGIIYVILNRLLLN